MEEKKRRAQNRRGALRVQESIEEHLERRRKRGEHRIEEEHLECTKA